MRIYLIMISLAIVGVLFAQNPEEERSVRRVFAYLKIGEYECGLQEASRGLSLSPCSLKLQEGLIRLLAKSGREKECYQAWNRYQGSFSDKELKQELLEEIAWGTLYKGLNSPTLYARVMALVGATITQDAYAVPIMRKCLKDSNSLIRSIAIELSSHLMDLVLEKEILYLLEKDPVSQVRMFALDAISVMELKEAEGLLKKMLLQDSLMAEERVKVVAALTNICKDVSLLELKTFATSNRAGLRLLACALLLEKRESHLGIHFLIPLLHDPCAEVKIAALNTLGLLQVKEINARRVEELIQPCLTDIDYKVALTATWLTTLLNPERGRALFYPWFFHKEAHVRRFAAAALHATGKYGILLTSRLIKESKDPSIRVQLSLAMIGQRYDVECACNEIFCFLSENNQLWMWENKSNPLFQVLVPSEVKYSSDEMISPEAVDQKLRLDLIHMLAVLEYPKTAMALKKFLKERTFGITGVAATMLIQECDKEAGLMVRELLHDQDPKTRVQAALVLGMWIRDKEAIAVLQEAYPEADRDLKIKILEAVGRIGDPASINFLLEAMQDPFLVVRIVAATSLILSLNH